MDGLPTSRALVRVLLCYGALEIVSVIIIIIIVVTRRLQAERSTGSVCRPKTDVLPTVLCNQPARVWNNVEGESGGEVCRSQLTSTGSLGKVKVR